MKEMEYKSKMESIVLESGVHDQFSFMILSLGTHPAAYVNIPEDHPFYKKDKIRDYIEVHGGLTFIGKLMIEPKISGWWVGWDYAHTGDYTRHFEGGEGNRKWTTKEIVEHVKEVIKQLDKKEIAIRSI